MKLKGTLKDASPWAQLLILVGVAIVGSVLFTILAIVVIFIQDAVSGGNISTIMERLMTNPLYLKESQFFAALGTYLLPPMICAYLFSDNYKEYLYLKPLKPNIAILSILCASVAIPAINFSYMVNQQMVFPEWLSGLEEWMKAMEQQMADVTERLLHAESAWDFILNIIVVAVLAGVGEEFMFRGTGFRIFSRIFKNPHVMIWLIAIIFSAIHMQFYGFLPRMLMGAFLGYLLYFTKNIWVPILAHFTNNAFGVVSYYILQDKPEEMQQVNALGWGNTWWVALASFALFVFLFMQVKKQSSRDN